MVKNINCKHCQLTCKSQAKTECAKYDPIANRPAQLPTLIREAIKNEDYELVNKLQIELDKFNYGDMLK